MLDGVIDCDQLGNVPDISIELQVLTEQNASLQKSNFLLQTLLFALAMGTTVYAIYSVMESNRRFKKHDKDENSQTRFPGVM